MANLTESSIWEAGIYQLETTDPVKGGADGISNTQAKQLANRTKYLNDKKAPIASPTFTGTPAAPTAADGTNTTQVATTAFVQGAVGGYLSKSITGGTITLTEAEASNPVIAFGGTLTANAIIVIPTTIKRLWAVYNGTSGAFTLTVKTASGTGVTVAQGKRNLVYTNGTNVYDGFNDFESIAMTGVPTAPTAAAGTNTTQVATTAFVERAVDLGKTQNVAPLRASQLIAIGTAVDVASARSVSFTAPSNGYVVGYSVTVCSAQTNVYSNVLAINGNNVASEQVTGSMTVLYPFYVTEGTVVTVTGTITPKFGATVNSISHAVMSIFVPTP